MSKKIVPIDNIAIKGTLLSNAQLKDYLEKVAAGHILGQTQKNTFPLARLIDNYKFISDVYRMLNEHVKLDLTIHPAGEWILDNFYIIEENIKSIIKELPLKKYLKFPANHICFLPRLPFHPNQQQYRDQNHN